MRWCGSERGEGRIKESARGRRKGVGNCPPLHLHRLMCRQGCGLLPWKGGKRLLPTVLTANIFSVKKGGQQITSKTGTLTSRQLGLRSALLTAVPSW